MKRKLQTAKFKLTPEQIKKIQPMLDKCETMLKKGAPMAIFAQLNPRHNEFAYVILIDSKTANQVQDVMQAAGYLSKQNRMKVNKILQAQAVGITQNNYEDVPGDVWSYTGEGDQE